MTADIEKMYYQAGIPDNQRDFLRFLWFRDGDLQSEPEEFRLKVHVFGATSSPSCSNFALKETANSQMEKFSRESVDIVNKNFYVDDLLLSTKTEEDAIRLAKEIRELCSSRRFNLVQFSGNSKRLMNSLPSDALSNQYPSVSIMPKDSLPPLQRVLGMKWNVQEDTLRLDFDLPERPSTRRSILSSIHAVFDTLGFVSPAMLPAKRILQEHIRLRVDWDEEIPLQILRQLESWLRDVHQ